MRRARPLSFLTAALVALAAGTATAADPPPPSSTAPVPTTPPPAHPAQATGWALPAAPGLLLSAAPDAAIAPTRAVPSTRIAGQVLQVAWGNDGRVWLQLLFPDRLGGWAPGDAVVAAPAPAAPSPAAQAAVTRGIAALGPGGALVVRDTLGRTIIQAGTTRALSLASVTKLATMAATLQRRSVSAALAARVLGDSDNDRAQRLSTDLGGGSRAAGARAAREAVAALGVRIRLVDGSGLSPGNRATAQEITDLLLAMRDQPRFPVFFRGLSVAGRRGTLGGRMRGTSASGRVRAKTGTLFDHPTSSLCGYFWPAGSGLAPDRAMVVCMLENGVSPYRARPAQDAVMAALTASGAFVAPAISSRP
ncbi:MAG: D-alanyl-D-alanine carboxypeptidase [Thermoleophilia bacterium]